MSKRDRNIQQHLEESTAERERSRLDVARDVVKSENCKEKYQIHSCPIKASFI